MFAPPCYGIHFLIILDKNMLNRAAIKIPGHYLKYLKNNELLT